MHNSQITGTLAHGVVFEAFMAEAYVIPEKSGQVDATLRPLCVVEITVTAQLPAEVDFPQVLQGSEWIYLQMHQVEYKERDVGPYIIAQHRSFRYLPHCLENMFPNMQTMF
jgi:hypothetical protein